MGMHYQPVPARKIGFLVADTTPACGRCGRELENPRPGFHQCADCRDTEAWEEFVRRYDVPIFDMHEDDLDILIADRAARARWRSQWHYRQRAADEQEQVAA